jgi:hypothetical protein
MMPSRHHKNFESIVIHPQIKNMLNYSINKLIAPIPGAAQQSLEGAKY